MNFELTPEIAVDPQSPSFNLRDCGDDIIVFPPFSNLSAEDTWQRETAVYSIREMPTGICRYIGVSSNPVSRGHDHWLAGKLRDGDTLFIHTWTWRPFALAIEHWLLNEHRRITGILPLLNKQCRRPKLDRDAAHIWFGADPRVKHTTWTTAGHRKNDQEQQDRVDPQDTDYDRLQKAFDEVAASPTDASEVNRSSQSSADLALEFRVGYGLHEGWLIHGDAAPIKPKASTFFFILGISFYDAWAATKAIDTPEWSLGSLGWDGLAPMVEWLAKGDIPDTSELPSRIARQGKDVFTDWLQQAIMSRARQQGYVYLDTSA